jgi:aryl-alcohol dehydrogenase-like predicted oxidoreductase
VAPVAHAAIVAPRRSRVQNDGARDWQLGASQGAYRAHRPASQADKPVERGRPLTLQAATELLVGGDHIAPIPGTKRVSCLEENAGADALELTADQLARLDAIPPPRGRPLRRHDPHQQIVPRDVRGRRAPSGRRKECRQR